MLARGPRTANADDPFHRLRCAGRSDSDRESPLQRDPHHVHAATHPRSAFRRSSPGARIIARNDGGPKEAYIDTWVGDRAVEYIQNQPEENPFFMFIGFPNPHIPFDAPEPYASMYNPADVPLPPTFNLDLSNKPPHQLAYKQKGRRVNYEHLDEPHLRHVIAT